jgi:CIC family chloride channel protein
MTARFLGRLILWTAIIGVGSGLGAVGFRKLIGFFTWFFFTKYAGWTAFMGPVRYMTIPVIGALIFGPMIWRWAREARGHGVPEVMEAVALRGGRIRPVVAVVKSLASSLNIGSGGSVGREGPIAQIGAALASTLGQSLRLDTRLLRLMVAAGTAGGISATFNAPLAGAVFGMEVILREFSTEAFVATGVSAALADVISVPFLGTKPFFPLPAGVGLRSPWELVIYAVLGVLAAGLGTGFTWLLYWAEDRFNAWKLHEAIRPAAGALLLGVLIMFIPEVRGLGYNVMGVVFAERMPLAIMALYLVGKFVATTLTLGSGGSGGIFTPTLYMGTMLGGAVGLVSQHLFPGVVGQFAGYALVGAATVFAAAARAPITAILIVMEMSQNYVLALPLVLAVVIATRLGDVLLTDSIYTLKLVRRGVHIFSGTAVDVLQQVTVKDAMIRDVSAANPAMSVADAAQILRDERRSSLPVVRDDRVLGIVTVTDLEQAHEMPGRTFTVGDVMSTELVVAYPDESLRDAVKRMSGNDVGQLVVVDPLQPDHMLGLLRRVDVVNGLEAKLGRSPELAQGVTPPASREGAFTEVVMPRTSPLVRHALKDVRFPDGMLVVSVTRGGQAFPPHGGTELLADDRLLIYVVPKSDVDSARLFVETGSTSLAVSS